MNIPTYQRGAEVWLKLCDCFAKMLWFKVIYRGRGVYTNLWLENNNNISNSKPLSWKVGFYVELWILNSFNNFWLNSFHWVEKQSCWERIKFFPQLSPVSGLSKLDLHWDIECCVEYSHDCKLLAVFSILLLSDQPDQQPAVSECGVAEQFYAGIEPSVERLGRVELQSAAFLAADGAVTDARTNVLTDSRTDRRAVSRLLQTKSWYSQSQSLLQTDNINSILNNINNIECPSTSAASSLTMASW